ncbi:hypothetical protein [uncultured Tateyamaria sp.]|uniref:hypothetical protein n=1 Tax=uncultured Tateyamaria sp. TaxID=455651 RepID=UPI00263714EE|nr:hypothetical protein [uncultured Tateyamaria sp.]
MGKDRGTSAQGLSQPGLLIAAGFFSAVFIGAAQDVAVWIHCLTRQDCIKGSTNVINAKYAGLALGSMLSIVVAGLAARHRRKPVQEALLLIIGIFAAGLMALLKIAVGDRLYPDAAVVDVPLFIYAVLVTLVLTPLFFLRDRHSPRLVWLLYGRFAMATLLGALVTLALFGFEPSSHFLPHVPGPQYILLPYALICLPAAWASMCAAPLSRLSRSAFSRRARLAWLALFAGLTLAYAALYGLTPDMLKRAEIPDRSSSAALAAFLLVSAVATGVIASTLTARRDKASALAAVVFCAILGAFAAARVVLPATTTLLPASQVHVGLQFGLCLLGTGIVCTCLDGIMHSLRARTAPPR